MAALFFEWGACAESVAPRAEPVALPAEPVARVVAVSDARAVSQFRVADRVVGEMLAAGMRQLTGRPNLPAALGALVSPSDVVGIRVATGGGPVLGAKPALLEPLIFGLRRAGVPETNIVVWDRSADEMMEAGLRARKDGVRVLSVVPATGYERTFFYLGPTIGELIWGDLEFVGRPPSPSDLLAEVGKKGNGALIPEPDPVPRQESQRSFFARIPSSICTKIINVAGMWDREGMGFEGCTASLAMAAVDNNRRFLGPRGDFGDPAFAEILAREPLRDRVVLHIMDGLLAQYAGGPKFNPQYCKPHATLYFGRDPVAVDVLALARIDGWRAEKKLEPLKPRARYLLTAQGLGLGEAHGSNIVLEALEP